MVLAQKRLNYSVVISLLEFDGLEQIKAIESCASNARKRRRVLSAEVETKSACL